MTEDAIGAAAITAVVPVFNGKSQLEVSLPALLRAGSGHRLRLIVVDDGSDDGSAETARALGATVLDSGGRKLGPAAARNVGAAAANTEIVLFVDADVAVHPDVLDHVVMAFREHDVVALFGAYDDSPPHRGFASQYMNLRHHYIHQNIQQNDKRDIGPDGHGNRTREAQTFWTGLGAVRRDAMLAVGGFDADRYPQPSIEDIELGHRMRVGGGRILCDPGMRGAHLKIWSLPGVVQTDVFQRALPWARLMHEHPGEFSDLNVGTGERLKAVLAGALVLSTGLALIGHAPAWLPIALFAVALWANRGLARLFWQRNGFWFALRAILYHQVYFVYSAASFVWTIIEHHLFTRTKTSAREST
jgi:GT2 family glycosyltransferase